MKLTKQINPAAPGLLNVGVSDYMLRPSMCIRTTLLICLFATSFLAVQGPKAAVITTLEIEVNGNQLLATFNDFSVPMSFNSIWDDNGDGDFTNDTSGFNFVPYFWYDTYGALDAAEKLLLALGHENSTDASNHFSSVIPPYDYFIVPTQGADFGVHSTDFMNVHETYGALNSDAVIFAPDSRSTNKTSYIPWVTFSEIGDSMGVSIPNGVHLLLVGLLVLAGRRMTRRIQSLTSALRFAYGLGPQLRLGP